ncbi:hypothetical protein C8Q74DRAFT_306580 [Fomes fomentarius]|nr:hypothetical protein C8Q74DRAFT_306580 [Fomes fomentarius]
MTHLANASHTPTRLPRIRLVFDLLVWHPMCTCVTAPQGLALSQSSAKCTTFIGLGTSTCSEVTPQRRLSCPYATISGMSRCRVPLRLQDATMLLSSLSVSPGDLIRFVLVLYFLTRAVRLACPSLTENVPTAPCHAGSDLLAGAVVARLSLYSACPCSCSHTRSLDGRRTMSLLCFNQHQPTPHK